MALSIPQEIQRLRLTQEVTALSRAINTFASEARVSNIRWELARKLLQEAINHNNVDPDWLARARELLRCATL
jgi:hypothetical protein